jgi:hypothetical protein
MAGRPTAFKGAVIGTLLEALRRGAFDWVAAEAAGINRRSFYRWMKRAEAGEVVYQRFADQVRRAKAEARLEAEARVLASDPLSWLRMGPGRERRGEPGWTLPAAAMVAGLAGEEEGDDETTLELYAEIAAELAEVDGP